MKKNCDKVHGDLQRMVEKARSDSETLGKKLKSHSLKVDAQVDKIDKAKAGIADIHSI